MAENRMLFKNGRILFVGGKIAFGPGGTSGCCRCCPSLTSIRAVFSGCTLCTNCYPHDGIHVVKWTNLQLNGDYIVPFVSANATHWTYRLLDSDPAAPSATYNLHPFPPNGCVTPPDSSTVIKFNITIFVRRSDCLVERVLVGETAGSHVLFDVQADFARGVLSSENLLSCGFDERACGDGRVFVMW